MAGSGTMINKNLLVFTIFLIILLFTNSAKADLKPDEDLDNDGYDFNGDGKIDQNEKFTNKEEYENGTDPKNPDTDNDTMIDGWEAYFGLNPKWNDSSNDTDKDGLTNLEEWNYDTNPNSSDTENDKMPDKWEIDNGLKPKENDSWEDKDKDGLINLEEYNKGTNPNDEDTDNDGLKDGEDPYPLIPANNRKIVIDTASTNINIDVYQIFEPKIDLKRGAVVDAVSVEDRNYTIFVNDTKKIKLDFSYGKYTNVYDGIWKIDLSQNFTPIPSITPDNKLLRFYSNEKIEFYKDKADNLYVRSNVTKTIYLAYSLVTNDSYFDLEVPDNLIAGNRTSSNDVPKEVWVKPSEKIFEKVEWFLNNSKEPLIYNLKNESNFSLILNNLTEYFSNFSSGEVPDANVSYDVYQTIAINKIGASWHRCFAFFVTANALGVPTRFVFEPRLDENSQDRARAFLEVYIPKKGGGYNSSRWKRIDLGYCENINKKDIRPEKNGKLFSNITIVSHPKYANKTKTFYVKGNVTNQTNTPIPYLSISIYINGTKSYFLNYSRTNENGEFNFTCIVPNSIYPGFRKIAVKSNRTYIFNESWNFSYISILANTSINLTTQSSVGKGNNLNIVGYLKDQTNLEIGNKEVNIYWDNKLINRTRTNDFGEFNYIYRILKNESSGSHYLNMTFNGTKYLGSSNFTKIINVKQGIYLNATLNCTNVTIGRNFTVIGNLTNETGGTMENTGNIVIILNENILRNVTLTNKNFKINCTVPLNVPSGERAVLIKYVPDNANKDRYPEASVLRNITILGIKTKLILVKKDAVRGNFVKIEGSLMDINGNGVDFEEIAINWNNSWVGKAKTDNGEFSFNFKVPNNENLGSIEVKAVFNETSEYKGSENSTNYTVYSDTFIKLNLNPSTLEKIYRNSKIYLNGTLKDNLDSDLENMNIDLWYDQGYLKTTTTNENGNFSFVYNVDKEHDLGKLTFTFKFGGKGLYLKTNKKAEYEIWTKTKINISSFPTSAVVGDNIIVKGSIIDDMGNKLDKIIYLKLGILSKSQISENGNFSFNLTIPQSQEPKNHTLKVEFKGSGYYMSSIDKKNVIIKRTTNITFSIPKFIYRNSLLNIEGKLIDNMGFGLSNKEIEFYWNNKYIGKAITENGGKFSTHYFINYSQSLGEVNITAKFNGTTFYMNTSKNISITVKADTEFLINSKNVFRNKTIVINGTIYEKEKPLENISLNISWNKKFINSTITDENGNFSLSYYLNSSHHLGKINVTIEFNGTEIDLNLYSMTNYTVIYYVVANTAINISDVKNKVVGENIKIFGNLTDDLGNCLNETLDIIFDLELIKTVNAKNGFFTANWTLPMNTLAKNHNLTVKLRNYFPKEGVYYLPASETEFVAIQRFSKIELSDYNKLSLRNKKIYINGTLLDNMNEKIGNEKIEFYWDGKYFGNTTTLSNGSFSHNFIIPKNQDLGIINFTVQFNETDFYKNFSLNKNCTVIANTTIKITDFKEKLSVGENLFLNGSIVDDFNNNLNQKIDIIFDKKIIGNVTSLNGNFSFEWKITKEIPSGNYSLEAGLKNFYPFSFYLFSNDSKIITIQTTTNITISPLNLFRNETNKIKGNLIDNMNRGIDNLTINFFMERDGNETYLGNTTTFNKGNFSFEFDIINFLGNVNITAKFNGTQFYASSNITINAKVKVNITIILLPKEVFRNETFKINGKVLEGKDELENLKVHIFWNNFEIGNDTTNFNGEFFVNYLDNKKLGLVNVTALLDREIKDLEFYSINQTSTQYRVIANTSILFYSKTVYRNEIISINGKIKEGNSYFENLSLDIIWNKTKIGNVITDENGNFSLQYKIDKYHELGIISVKVKLNETKYNFSNYLESNKTVNYKIFAKTKINISYAPKNVIVGNKITVYGNFSDDLNNSLEKMIYLRFLGEQKTLVPENKEFNWSFDVPLYTTATEHQISVNFYRDGFYEGANDSKKIIVKRISKIFLISKDVYRGGRVKIEGKLLDNLNKGFIENVKVEWNGSFVGFAKSDANGNFYIYHWDNESLGKIEIRAILQNSKYYTDSKNNTNFTVFANTTINFYPKYVYRNKTFEINGTVTENNILKTKSLPLIITWNKTKLNTTTSEDGNFLVNYKVEKNYPLGEVNVLVEIDSTKVNLSLYINNQTTTIYTVVAKTNINFTSKNINAIGKEITIFGNLTDDFGNGLNKTIVILLDGNEIINVNTNDSGSFKTTFEVPSDINAGIHNLTVKFNGENYHLESFKSLDIQFKYPTNIVINNLEKQYRNNNITISGTLYDITHGLKGLEGIVDIYWNNRWIASNFTTSKGKFLVQYFVKANHELGDVEIKVVYNGTGSYCKAEDKINFEIWAKTYMNLTKKFPTPLILFRNDEIIIEGKVKENSKGVEGLQIDLLWNTTFQNSTKTTKFGNFSFNYKINETQPLGNYNLIIQFHNKKYYEDSSEMIKCILKNRTRLILDSKVGIRGENIKIKGSFDSEEEKAPIIQILWNDKYVGNAEIINNTFIFNYTIPISESKGKINVTAKFHKDSFYVNSTNSTFIILAKTNFYKMEIPKLGVVGETIHIEGNLEEIRKIANSPIKGNISIFFDELKIETIKVDGYFTKLIEISRNISVGMHNITVKTVNFDSLYLANTSYMQQIFIKGIVNIKIDEIKTYRNKKINILGNVEDNIGNKLDGYLEIYWDNKFLTKTTVKNGMFSFEYELSKNEKLGNVSVRVWYQGSNLYEDINYTVNFTILGKTSITLIFPEKIIRGEKFQAQILLNDEYGNGIADMVVFVQYRGIRIELITNENGRASFSATVFNETALFKVFFEGNYYLDSSEHSQTITSILPPKEEKFPKKFVFIVLIIAFSSFGCCSYAYIWKKKKPKKEVIEPLIKGDTPKNIAKRAYQKVARALRKYGFTRKKSQTVREFENVVTKNLKVDKKSLDKVTDVYEEAVYSTHDITEKKAKVADFCSEKVEKSLKVNVPHKKKVKVKLGKKKIKEKNQK